MSKGKTCGECKHFFLNSEGHCKSNDGSENAHNDSCTFFEPQTITNGDRIRQKKMNNDRFRFRVWDKAENKYNGFSFHLAMSGELDRLSVDGDLLETDEERFTVEQCTGLKDKNGKLIYEGDLLGDSKDDEEFIEICWCDTLASFMYDIFPETYGNLETFDADYLAQFEIIGNIHEMEGI